MGIFTLRAEALELTLSEGVTQDGLDLTRVLWKGARADLAAGKPCWRGTHHCLLLPGLHDGHLRGLV